MMKHFEFSWLARDELSIYAQGWEPETTPKAIVCLVHGLGEHSGRYSHVAEHLTGAGFVVLTFDLPGHGQSGGTRGHIPSNDLILDQVEHLLIEAKRRYPDLPRFLYGHSLGGIIVLHYTLKRQPDLAGVIATSSGLRTSLEAQTLKVSAAKILASIMPAYCLPTGLKAEDISHDSEVVQKYLNDPLVHDQASFAMAKNTFSAIQWTFEHADEFKPPLLLMHGSEDRIAFARGSEEFAKLVNCDCTLKIWDGLYHETHNEPEKEQVLDYATSWLMSKL